MRIGSLGAVGAVGSAGGGSTPAWVFTNASVDMDFLNNQFYGNSISNLTIARTVTGTGAVSYVGNLAGTYAAFADNTRRYTSSGLWMEEARTNVVLRNRDLTNVAWTPTNITAAKDQTGIDGAANSASSILATAGNGTIIQTTTIASSARWQTAFVKRITGSGTINMTMDNGTTWTPITVTGSWTRVSIPSQTLANPQVGFQIVTSGDNIAVDFVQNENSGFHATTPILTLDAAGVRSADVPTLANTPTFGAAFSMFVRGTSFILINTGNSPCPFSLNIASQNNEAAFQLVRTSGFIQDILKVGGVSQYVSTVVSTNNIGVSVKMASALAAGDQRSCSNGTLGTAHTVNPIIIPTTVSVGCRAGNTLQWNGPIERFAIWPTSRISDAYMQTITT